MYKQDSTESSFLLLFSFQFEYKISLMINASTVPAKKLDISRNEVDEFYWIRDNIWETLQENLTKLY